jgi:hypothetical protein
MSPAPAIVHFRPQPGQPLSLRSVLLFAACSFAVAAANAGPATASHSAGGITTTDRSLAPAEDKKPAPKIYKFLSGGTTSFSDTPPRTGAYIVLGQDCYACKLSSNIDWHSTRLHRDEFTDEINLAARQFNLDPALVRAVIHAESGFNARARSNKGAIGLMQLMPATAKLLGVADARAPSHNIRGGTQYLAGLLARFKNDIVLATAAYNAGPEAVQKYAGVPPYAETQVYVQRVRILHQRYKSAPQV